MPDLPLRIDLKEKNLEIVIRVNSEGKVALLHWATSPFTDTGDLLPGDYALVEVQVTGEDRGDHHDVKHVASIPGRRLVYVSHVEETTESGRLFSLVQRDPVSGLEVTSYLQFYSGLAVVRSWTKVVNNGQDSLGLEYVSSFALTGLVADGETFWEDSALLHIPHNTWCEELQWRSYRLPELGLSQITKWQHHPKQSLKRLSYQSVGSWSTSQYLPMGIIENTANQTAIAWQIESNGEWQWEISDRDNKLYLRLSGPTDQEHHWWKELEPGEKFETVTVAVAASQVKGPEDFSALEQVLQDLTRYRRKIRRPNADNENLPVIFNDYMNALMGDPTTEKELPLVEAAAKAGCEIYCIDAGWYAARGSNWWDTVGDWQPSPDRFEGGLAVLTRKIRESGMAPGLWLELEVIGVKNPIVSTRSDDWFFCRHGKRVIDKGRYQLDYRNPVVREFADSVVDRLINDYDIGYIKMDYNINAGVGTDYAADSAGDGLLEHNRAYLGWLEEVFARHPDLVIENCSSGGMRLDYAMLQRHSIQSTSDQMDYRRYGTISAAAPSGVTPEQSAIWAYPLKEANREEVIFNMVNAVLGRIHQSGALADQTPEGLALIEEALGMYKTELRSRIKTGVPIWPLGLPAVNAGWSSLGLVCEDGREKYIYLAVWRFEGTESRCALPLPQFKSREVEVSCIYPAVENQKDGLVRWDGENGTVEVSLDNPYTARLFRVEL